MHLLIICDFRSIASQIYEGLFRLLSSKYGYSYKYVYISNLSEINETAALPIFMNTASAKGLSIKKRLVESGIPYIYIADDDFLNLEEFRYLSEIRSIVKNMLADAAYVVVASRGFESEIKKINTNVIYVPPYFDFTHFFDLSYKKTPNEIRIGYPSLRLKDLELASDGILNAILCGENNVYFESFGIIPKNLMRGEEKIRYHAVIPSYHDFICFKASRCWDIGIAPLLGSPGRPSKTNNKYREFGALGVCGLYSSTEPYLQDISHLENGVLVGNSPQDWSDAILEIIHNHDLRKKIASNAYDHVKTFYSISNTADHWAKILSGFESLNIRSSYLAKFSTVELLHLYNSALVMRLNKYKARIINLGDTIKRRGVHEAIRLGVYRLSQKSNI